MLRLLKKGTIKFAMFIKSPRRVEKLVDTASFHKKCEYHQADIEYLFEKKIFDKWSGCAEIHRGEGQGIRESKVFIRQKM